MFIKHITILRFLWTMKDDDSFLLDCENVILANKLKYIINGQNLTSYVQQTVVSLSKFRV